MMDFLNVAGSFLFGGATGILGTVLGKGLEIWEAREKRENLKIQNAHELALQDKMIAARAAETEGEIAIGELGMRSDSYQHDSSYGQASPWVINFLRLVRPGLTVGLIILLAIIYFKLIPAERAVIADGVAYMASSAVLWWFGDRMTRSKK